ncbi:protease [Aquibacillus halophilus]|uniref:Protease n=1 Tax=Aquibacillus halophilus TaxID=930132 RepID=A0A6A8DDH1_9BACI|nr:NfeD family protein [Aquibacillus halophilus]MRH43733.1 protease [Aquibacillus halophilus]
MLFGSLGIAIISLFLGDVLEGLLDSLFDSVGEFLNPLLLFSTLSVIGGSGVLLTKYTDMNNLYVLILSLFIGAGSYFLIYYFLVTPMSNAEASTSISIFDLEGKVGEVITTIPANGMGEIFIESTNGSRNETAMSFDGVEIKQGTEILVIQVIDNVLYVSELEEF